MENMDYCDFCKERICMDSDVDGKDIRLIFDNNYNEIDYEEGSIRKCRSEYEYLLNNNLIK